jgi:hypothetical protein
MKKTKSFGSSPLAMGDNYKAEMKAVKASKPKKTKVSVPKVKAMAKITKPKKMKMGY